TPMFRVNGGEWTTEIPTGKEAGEYVVEYYADGDKGFKDSEIQTVTVEIAEKSSSNNKPSKPSLNKKDHVEIFSGYPDGTFRPKKAMTRAEVAVVFSKLMKPAMVEGKTYTTNFSDVETGKWYSNAIGFMVEQGILSGYTDGTFRPNQEITRAEFATIATKFEELTVGGDHKFSDVPETSWAYTFINFAAERGYVSGYSDGTFRPGKSITREEVATVLCKVLEREADKEYIKAHADEVTHFSDVEEKDWSYWFILEATNGHEYTKADNVETWTEIK
ncbi:MAG: S-layer homology domain-containing protein, partial [Firmicutes bacterium]|nr:S-layer homology domain-containing protein [Bacillota bacterium]